MYRLSSLNAVDWFQGESNLHCPSIFRSALSAAFCTLVSSCTTATAPLGAEMPYGESKLASIEVCRPQGERAYLSRLMCASGAPVAFSRMGGVGLREDAQPGTPSAERMRVGNKMITYQPLSAGEPHIHIVDQYQVTCGETRTLLYFDMYHCDVPAPTRAPNGFTLNK
jgi:hypothetical protein